jgi:DNA-binding transcriptional MerR regulator
VTLTQYRIGDLAQASGVNARNIRAYRERGLLDPPRREGRSAIYSDLHLAQLRVINQLLAKGFTSSHIADFFDAMRSGHDLADVLGLYDVFADGDSADAGAVQVTALPLEVDLASAEARRMMATGLAGTVGGRLMLVDPELVRIVSRAPNQRQYLATIVEVFASAQDGIAAAAEDVDTVLTGAAAELVRELPPEPSTEPVRVPQDYRELAAIVIARQVDEAVRRQAVRSTA